jgi:hypothetical protein
VDKQPGAAAEPADSGLPSYEDWGSACALWPAGGRASVGLGEGVVDETSPLQRPYGPELPGNGSETEGGILALYARICLCATIKGHFPLTKKQWVGGRYFLVDTTRHSRESVCNECEDKVLLLIT